MLAQWKERASLVAISAKESAIEAKQAALEASKRGSEILHEKASQFKDSALEGKETEETTGSKLSSTSTSRRAPESTKEEDSLLDELNEQCQLTRKQRLQGAIICYIMGGLCSILSTLALLGGGRHLPQFAFFYTVGNCCSIGSSMFLVGPCRQVKVMCLPVRRVAATIWIVTMILTLIVAFTLPQAGLVVLLLICIQYAAMLWYGTYVLTVSDVLYSIWYHTFCCCSRCVFYSVRSSDVAKMWLQSRDTGVEYRLGRLWDVGSQDVFCTSWFTTDNI